MSFFRSTACRRPRGLAPLFVAAFLAATGHAADPPATSSDAQRLVFLLEYVGTDYDAAVRDGQVVNQFEYGEMLRLTKQLITEYGAREQRSEAVTTGLAELEQLIRQRAPAEQVWAASRRLLPPLARTLGVIVRPQTVPNLANGRRLWSSDCAPCHGPTGAGDGPAAADMEPPPTAFVGDALDQLSPRQAFNALTFGIDGTAMPSFAPAYTDEERWDVAFFLMTLRTDFQPKRPLGDTRLSLDELAAHSNVELLSRLRQRWPDLSVGEVDWMRTNLAAAFSAAPAPTGPESGSGGLAVALQLQDTFGRVADRVLPRVVGVTGYVRDAAWSAERLQAERGDAWIAANADAVRYPGFRPLRSGSGVLEDEGYVISCDHIVRDDRNEVVEMVDIELPDQTHVPGGVVGSEPTLDLGHDALATGIDASRSGDLQVAMASGARRGGGAAQDNDPTAISRASSIAGGSSTSAPVAHASCLGHRRRRRLDGTSILSDMRLGSGEGKMTTRKIALATVLLLALAAPAQAGNGNDVCPAGFNERFNVNQPGCTFCSAPTDCQIMCVGPSQCFCTPGNTACCADNPCCVNCPEPKPLRCSTSRCDCTPESCCSTICPTAAPVSSAAGLAALTTVLVALGMGALHAARQRR